MVIFLPGPLSRKEVPPLPHTYLIGGLVNLTAVLDAVERQKPLPLPGIIPRFVDNRNL